MCILCFLIPVLTGLVAALLGYLLGKRSCNGKDATHLYTQFDALKIERDRLQSVNDDLNAKLSNSTGDASLRATISGLENEVLSLKAKLSDCESKSIAPPLTDDWKTKFEELTSEFTTHKASADNKINTLTGELDALRLAATPIVPDDLKIVEGIGPKIEQILNTKNILTFKQLANTTPERIREILEEQGPSYKIHDPGTWPKQAQLAFEGKWDELKAWQDELNAGK